MGRRSLVTFEDVKAAAEALVAAGQTASAPNVLKVLGRGSPNTLQRFLDVLNQQESTEHVIAVPQEILQRLNEWCRRDVEDVNRKSEALLDVEHKVRSELEAEIEELESAFAASKARIDELEGKVAQRDQRMIDLHEALHSATTEVAAAARKIGEAESDAAIATADAAAARHAAGAAAEECARSAAREAAVAERLHEVEQSAARAEATIASTDARLTAAEQRSQDALQRERSALERAAAAETNATTARAFASSAEQHKQEAEGRERAVRAELQELRRHQTTVKVSRRPNASAKVANA